MKTRSPTIAKVTRPIPTGVYPRKRLFDLLDRKQTYPVIWILGPPGCGKTTLVTSYLETKESPCLWYQADEGEADPATFFYYLGLAVKKATPRKRKPLPLLTPEYLPGLPTFTLRFFENIFYRLQAPSFIVFDNYQEVPLASPFHEVIRHGLSNIPNGIHVILISRSGPPPVLIHMQANNRMEMIGWQDLRLTLKESNDIVKLRARHEVSTETIKHLHTITDGWVAGLMLTIKTAALEKIDPHAFDTISAERVFDYFTGEIFDKVDEKIQNFLLKTALFPKMTASMARQLTGFESAHRILSQLNRNNYFTERRFRSSPAFEYHPLFRAFLLSRAEETFSTEFLSDLRRRAAMLLEEDDQTEAAIDLMRDSGDWEKMISLILKHAPEMLAQGRNLSLQQWLSNIPKDIIETTPWILYWMGSCNLPFDPSKSRRFFEKAFTLFKKQKDAAGTFLSWSGAVDSIYFSWEFKQFDKWFHVLEEVMQTFEKFPTREIEGRVATNMVQALYFRQPQHPEMESWTKRALSLGRDNKDVEDQVRTLLHAALDAVFKGGIPKAIPFLESLHELTKSSNVSHLDQIAARLVEADCYLFNSSFKKGIKAVSEGLQLSQSTGVHIMDSMLLGNLTEFALEMGDLKAAGNEIEKMFSLLGDAAPFLKSFYHFIKSRLALFQNNLAQAAHHARLASDLAGKIGLGVNTGLCWLREAMILYQSGKYQQGTRLQKKALAIARRSKSRVIESKALLTAAYFALDRRDKTSGLKLLRKALAMAKELQYYFSPDDDAAVTARICAIALENGIEVDHVQKIIRKRNLVLDDPPLHLDNWPWAIQIYTLGRFDMVIDEKPFTFLRKTQKKPLEMLKLIVSFGEGQEVGKSQLSDILWPDADGDKAQRSFDTTLHRLRQLLGHEKAIHLRDGRLSIDQRYCWVDSMAFEHILKQAENCAGKEDRKNTIQLLENAVSLYKGPFLAGETDESWTISHNERLRSKFLRCIEKLGNYMEEKGDLNRAVDCFRRAIEVDHMAEMFYRRLMICLKQLGRKTDALSVYQRCERTLSSSLELEPSQETKAIKQSLYE